MVKKITVILLGAVLLVVGVTAGGRGEETPEEAEARALSEQREAARRGEAQVAFDREHRIRKLRAQAKKLVGKKLYREALEKAGEILEIDPEDEEATALLGEIEPKAEEEERREKKQEEARMSKRLRRHLREGRTALSRDELELAMVEFEDAEAILGKFPPDTFPREDRELTEVLSELGARMAEEEKRVTREKTEKEKREKVLGARQKEKENREEIKGYLRAGKRVYDQGDYLGAIAYWEKGLALAAGNERLKERTESWIATAERCARLLTKDEVEKQKVESMAGMLQEVRNTWIREEGSRREPESEEEEIAGPGEDLRRKASLLIKEIDFTDADLRDVLKKLMKISEVDIVLDETALGEIGEEELNVTILLRDITLLKTLDVILRAKGLSYRLEPTLIWVTTVEKLRWGRMVTKTIPVGGGVGEIEEVLQECGVEWPEGSKLEVDEVRSTVTVKNTKYNIQLIERIIKYISEPPVQVLIDARFVRVERKASERLGFGWRLIEPVRFGDGEIRASPSMGEVGPGVFYQRIVDEGINVLVNRLTPTEFEFFLNMMELEGVASTLAAPRVIAMNNERAHVGIFENAPYIESWTLEEVPFLTGETVQSFNDELVPSGITSRREGVDLWVTPNVGKDRKRIALEIEARVSDPAGFLSYGTEVMITSTIYTVQEIRTLVDIYDGETIVLGGLKKLDRKKRRQTVPGLGSIPILGKLFGNAGVPDADTEDESNLLIFVSARIVEATGEPYRK